MSKLNEWLSTDERRMEFAEEELIVDAAEEIWAAMDATKLTKKDIADRLGKSKAYISQLLNGSRNMTLRSLADIAHCVGYRARISLEKQDAEAMWQPMKATILTPVKLMKPVTFVDWTAPPIAALVNETNAATGCGADKQRIAA